MLRDGNVSTEPGQVQATARALYRRNKGNEPGRKDFERNIVRWQQNSLGIHCYVFQ